MTTINPFNMYILEKEGYLSTRESKINKVIKAVKAYPAATIPENIFRQILKENDIEPNSLTKTELYKIQCAL